MGPSTGNLQKSLATSLALRLSHARAQGTTSTNSLQEWFGLRTKRESLGHSGALPWRENTQCHSVDIWPSCWRGQLPVHVQRPLARTMLFGVCVAGVVSCLATCSGIWRAQCCLGSCQYWPAFETSLAARILQGHPAGWSNNWPCGVWGHPF